MKSALVVIGMADRQGGKLIKKYSKLITTPSHVWGRNTENNTAI